MEGDGNGFMSMAGWTPDEDGYQPSIESYIVWRNWGRITNQDFGGGGGGRNTGLIRNPDGLTYDVTFWNIPVRLGFAFGFPRLENRWHAHGDGVTEGVWPQIGGAKTDSAVAQHAMQSDLAFGQDRAGMPPPDDFHPEGGTWGWLSGNVAMILDFDRADGFPDREGT